MLWVVLENDSREKKKKRTLMRMGFEPMPPKRLEP